jgi:hypothetical protein
MNLKTQAHYPHAYHEFIAKDPNGIPRCFGYGPDATVAYGECRMAIEDYVAKRPDCGPADDWTIEKAN